LETNFKIIFFLLSDAKILRNRREAIERGKKQFSGKVFLSENQT